MIYRVVGFLAVELFGSSPAPYPSPFSKLSFFLSLPICRRSSLLTGEGGGGAKSNDGEKAWSSMNHSKKLWSSPRNTFALNVQCIFLDVVCRANGYGRWPWNEPGSMA